MRTKHDPADIASSPLPLTIGGLFERAASLYSDRPAIIDQRSVLTYGELNKLRLRAAKAFFACGVMKGENVAVWAPNMSEYIVAAAGMQSIGAVLVPINTRFKTAETQYILNKGEIKTIVTVEEFQNNNYVEMLLQAELPQLERIILLRGNHNNAETWDDFLQKGDLVENTDGSRFKEEFNRRVTEVCPDDILDMMFTSGTTGMLKAARFTHRQSIETYDDFSTRMGDINEKDKYLIVNPFFHTFGYKAGWLSCVMRGTCIYPLEIFEPVEVMRLIDTEKITIFPGPPTIFSTLISHPDRKKFDLDSLRVSLTGATVIPVELIRDMFEELKIDIVVSAYGMTEACGLISTTLANDSPDLIANTVGTSVKSLTVKCIDSSGKEVETGREGELVIRGPNVMTGYFNDIVANSESFTEEGYLRTGDLGSIDENGYIRITGRIKDIYIVGGFNCYPAEIEQILKRMGGIDQVAVVGVPDERMGEVGKAYIIRSPGTNITPLDVHAWAKKEMANFKVPRYVEFVDSFPLNASFKVLKNKLREMHNPNDEKME